MKRPHASDDVRERALAAVEDGHRVVDVAAMYRGNASTLRRWRRQRNRTGSCRTVPRSGRPRRIGPVDEDALRAQVVVAPDASRALCPLAGDARRAGECADAGADAAADGHHAPKKPLIAGERDDAARARWRTERADIDPTPLIFLDETSTPTTLTPARGRSDRGTRVLGRVPRGRWDAVTLVATLTAIGLGPGVQVPGAVGRRVFDRFVTELLVPTLHPGDVVVLDNVAVPKSALAQQAGEAVGASLVFLPPSSPDFNPIEPAFATLKQRLRTVNARTIDTVMTAARERYPEITPSDACGVFAHAGYFF